MINGVIALWLQGYGLDSEPVRKGLEAIEEFSWEDADGLRIQACESPVWDTALSTIALIDSGTDRERDELRGAARWVLDRQLLVGHGDWKVYRPGLEPGGWSFEYTNSWYPDIDDTAAVVLMLLKQDPASAGGERVAKALRWMIGMQNRDGGWAAFDVDNDRHFLNEIPFSDMGSLCDPSTPDVTGRVLEALGLWLRIPGGAAPEDLLLRRQAESALSLGISYLRRTQEEQGSWYGRWGVNYIYGTSNALCGLAQAGVPVSDPMVDLAVIWLKHVQNRDGGWGESLASYSDRRWMGRGVSTASQTAWALMGLLSYAPPGDVSVERGVRWLVRHQIQLPEGGSWHEEHSTGTGFPNHFYLRYHLYRHYFPMMALGRYLSKQGE
jgi:squalene-hopene/tetraprenyl-beta-curcumene cyclase